MRKTNNGGKHAIPFLRKLHLIKGVALSLFFLGADQIATQQELNTTILEINSEPFNLRPLSLLFHQWSLSANALRSRCPRYYPPPFRQIHIHNRSLLK